MAKKVKKDTNNNAGKKGTIATRINIFILVITVFCVLCVIISDPGNISLAPYGAGDYYYTDLPNFGEIFFKFHTGTNHPVLFFALFILWGFLSWQLLKWVDKKINT